MIERAVLGLVQALLERELLELQPDATAAELAGELLGELSMAPLGSQVGSYLARAMMDSRLVVELYADDVQISRLLSTLEV